NSASTGTTKKSSRSKKSAKAESAAPAAATTSSPSAPAAIPSATPAAATTPAKPATTSKPAAQQQTPPANSAGMVWVNTDSGVYHKPGTRWYGKTKQGKYMTEADAQKAGYRAAEKE
ncbi:MAG: hypothetical protein JST77_04055, partial [Acidobacteria bacterium]|nr:hypothetical protein [Acidobacteriota bacterium]